MSCRPHGGRRQFLVPRTSLISLRFRIAAPLLAGLALSLPAQTLPLAPMGAAQPSLAAAALPDAPQPQGTGRLSGTVRQANNTAVPGSQVTVAGQNSGVRQTATVNSEGAFTFPALPADTYTVTITAPGMEPIPSEQVTLGAGATSDLPVVVTPLPRFTSTVHVTASTAQIATEQVHLAEKQRVLGVVPNFYTAYEWNAAPMTAKLKVQLSLRSLIDPFTFATAAGVAGFEQWRNLYPGYGRGAEGYGKRYGALMADTTISRLTGDALLPAAFHQDPRYFYRGSGSVLGRTMYALKETLMCRGDDGRQQPDYSRVLGAFIAAGASNLYHAPQDRSAGVTVRDGFIIIGSDGLDNLLREFITRGLTSHVPPTANGKH